MLLGPLTDALDLVLNRIRKFEREFANNEQQTRLSLVDPVLKALGWNPQDPSIVRVEYPVRQRNRNNKNKVDYALFALNQEPIAFIEAKSLGTDLAPTQLQLLEYAVGKSVPYLIATDGANWTVYKWEQHSAGMNSPKLLEVSILDQSPIVTAIKLLALWRGLLTSESSIDQIALALDSLKTHLLEPETESIPNPKIATENGHRQPVPERVTSNAPTSKFTEQRSDESQTFALSNPLDVTGKKPTLLSLPGTPSIRVKSWSSLLIEIAQWLIEKDRLIVDTPWKDDQISSRHIIQKAEISDRNGMRVEQQIEIKPGLFLLFNFSASNICHIAAKLLDDCGIHSSEVHVTLAHQER